LKKPAAGRFFLACRPRPERIQGLATGGAGSGPCR
jgi:hypothetical protein